jgi:transcriptional regulator with GAF, ATPase, and Fis domain
MIEDGYLCAKTFTNSWYTNMALELFGNDFQALKIKISDHEDHLMVKTIRNKIVTHSYLLRGFCSLPVPSKVADLAQKLTGHKSAVCFPLIVNNNVLGTILFTKNIADEFTNEYDFLLSFTESIAMAISNTKRFEELNGKLINI